MFDIEIWILTVAALLQNVSHFVILNEVLNPCIFIMFIQIHVDSCMRRNDTLNILYLITKGSVIFFFPFDIFTKYAPALNPRSFSDIFFASADTSNSVIFNPIEL